MEEIELIKKLNKTPIYNERKDKLKIELYKKKKNSDLSLTKLLSDYYIEEFVFDIDFWRILFKKYYEEKGFNKNYKEKCLKILEWGSFYNINNYLFWIFYYESFLKLEISNVEKEFFLLKKASLSLKYDFNLNIFLFKMLQILFINFQIVENKFEVFEILKLFSGFFTDEEIKDKNEVKSYIGIFCEGLVKNDIDLIFEKDDNIKREEKLKIDYDLFETKIDTIKEMVKEEKNEKGEKIEKDNNLEIKKENHLKMKKDIENDKLLIKNYLLKLLNEENENKIFRKKMIKFLFLNKFQKNDMEIFLENSKNLDENLKKEFFLNLIPKIPEKKFLWKKLFDFLKNTNQKKFIYFIIKKYYKIIGSVYPYIFQFCIIEQINSDLKEKNLEIKEILMKEIKKNEQTNYISKYLILFLIDKNNCEEIFEILIDKKFYFFADKEIYEILNILLPLLKRKNLFLEKLKKIFENFEDKFLSEMNSVLLLNYFLPLILDVEKEEKNNLLKKILKKCNIKKSNSIDILLGIHFKDLEDYFNFYKLNFENNTVS